MKKNTGIGILFIALATLILIGVFAPFNGINTYQLIVTFVMGWIFISSLYRLNFFGIFIPLGIIAITYAANLGITFITPFAIISASILFAIGFSIIFQKYTWHGKMKRKFMDENRKYYHYNHFSGGNRERYDDSSQHTDYSTDYKSEPIEDDNIFYASSFTSTTRFIKSDNLQSARFENELGELKVYLDQIELGEEGANIIVQCRLGNLELFIPKRFNVVNNIDVALGDASMPYQSTQNSDKDNTITLTGSVTLGNIQITRI